MRLSLVLQLFQLNPVQLSVVEQVEQTFLPLSQVEGSKQSILVEIPPTTDFFTSPKIYLRGTYKVTNADGTALADDANVAVVANSSHSWIKDLDFSVNDVPISGMTSGCYAYVAYLLNTFLESETQIHKYIV